MLTQLSNADGREVRALSGGGDVHANRGHCGQVDVGLGQVGKPPQQ